MKIVADENIELIHEFFSGFGDIVTIPGRQLSKVHAKEADILLVRSVTKVDQALLENSKLQFVGTCTIGTDHIDLAYLSSRGIGFASAPGCNANAVVDYVLSALATLALSKSFSVYEKCVGIIGQGNVGSRLRQRLEAMGVRCLCTDPLLQRSGVKGLVSLDEVIKNADIISIHTPLSLNGPDATFHLFDKHKLHKLKPGAILINSARGGVVDNDDLLAYLNTRQADLTLVLDVWENEPLIDIELMQHVDLATPHIAGYSLEGKITGTAMIYKAVSEFFRRDQPVDENFILPPKIPLPLTFDKRHNLEQQCYKAILSCYDIRKDDALLRRTLMAFESNEYARAESFDRLRKDYPQRRELGMMSISNKSENTEWVKKLQAAGIDVSR